MSYDSWSNDPYGSGWQNYDYSNNSTTDFGQQQQFQSFEYGSQNVSTGGQPISSGFNQSNYFAPGPRMMTPTSDTGSFSHASTSLEDEPPLLEELGIDPDAILQKTLNVLNPLRHTDPSILQDTDLAGPLVFCLAFGSLLLLSGKVHFGYIYGFGLLGCVSLYFLLNMMSIQGASFGVVVSVLGYCLLPMVCLAGFNVVFSLQGPLGSILTVCAILWCSWSASKLFITAFGMHHQQPLLAYPCALFYAVFALITIF